MTACVNNQNKEGAAKRAVSATLAGVLAVGMVPAVALAAPAEEAAGDDGLELLTGNESQNFANGYIDSIDLGGTTIALTANGTQANGSLASTPATGSAIAVENVAVKLATGTAAATADYAVTIHKATANNQPGAVVSSVVDPGNYVIVAAGKAGTDYEGARVQVVFSVTYSDLSGAAAYLANPDNAADFTGTFTYTGSALPVSFCTAAPQAALKANVDYTATYEKKNTVTGTFQAVGSVQDAGTYRATLTGLGQYVGQTYTTAEFTVAPFDLSSATITVNDITVGSSVPTQPVSVVDGTTVLNPSLVKLVQKTDSSNPTGTGARSLTALPANDSGNVINSADVTLNVVGAMASFQMNGAAIPASKTIDITKGESFSLNDIVAVYNDAAGKAQTLKQAFGATYATDSPVKVTVTPKDGATAPVLANTGWPAFAAANAGQFTIKVEVVPGKCGFAAGGSFTMDLTVYDGNVNATADAYIMYDGKAVTSLSLPFNGTTGYTFASTGANITATLIDGTGASVATGDYSLKVTDAEGNDVASPVKEVGAYTMTIASTKYNVTGNASIPVTINKLDIASPTVNATAGSTATALGDSIVTKNAAGYEYIDTSSNVTLTNYAPYVNVGTADDPNYVEIGDATATPGITVQWQKLNKTTNEWEDVTATDNVTGAANYRAVITSDADNAGNYELASAEGTIINYVGIPTAEFKFVDVLPGEWYFATAYDAIGVVTNATTTPPVHLMNGTSDTTFAPNAVMTRAMAAGVMCNMSGSDPETIDVTTTFSDVPTDAWFAKAVSWAQETGTVNGKSAGTFDPNGNVTREQFMAMLSNYAKHTGMYKAVDTDAVLGQKADGSSVSDWARECVAWGVANKIIGKGDAAINPQGSMTRAEAASMALSYWTGIAGQAI